MSETERELQAAIMDLMGAIIWYRAVLPPESWLNVPLRCTALRNKGWYGPILLKPEDVIL